METYVGLDGQISCPRAMGITVKTVQADLTDPAATGTNITLSGVLGTRYSFSATSPIFGDLVFKMDESIYITRTGTEINNVIINYIKRGDQSMYMQCDPSRVNAYYPGKWKVPSSGVYATY